MSVLSDGLDHPELWLLIPDFVASHPALVPALKAALSSAGGGEGGRSARLLLALCGASLGDLGEAIAYVEAMAADYSQSPMVQGVWFHLQGLADPHNPKYALVGKI